MDPESLPPSGSYGPATDKLFYFFLGLRKGEIRRRVATLRSDHPDEGPDRLARRLIAAQAPLSLLGGALMHAPVLLPGIGTALRLLGVAGGASVMMRMHMFLILEIALLFGRDIDERARLKEMLAVIAATGLTSGMPLLVRKLGWEPWYGIAAGSLATTGISQAIGEAAIRYYAGEPPAGVAVPSEVAAKSP
jgi:hypothetical protein